MLKAKAMQATTFTLKVKQRQASAGKGQEKEWLRQVKARTVAQPLFGLRYPVPLEYFKVMLLVATGQRPQRVR